MIEQTREPAENDVNRFFFNSIQKPVRIENVLSFGRRRTTEGGYKSVVVAASKRSFTSLCVRDPVDTHTRNCRVLKAERHESTLVCG